METLRAYGENKKRVKSSNIFGPDLCKYYARPLDVKTKLGDAIEIECESDNESVDGSVLLLENICEISFVTVATQTDYRESETQTDPWDPPFIVKKILKVPEVLHLKDLVYGDGLPVTQTEIKYILESRKNRNLDIFAGGDCLSYEIFLKKKELICNQVRNEWNYKISKHSEKLVDKLKQMESALAQELTVKSERQEMLLKSLWIQKKEQMSKMNSKLQRELKKELKSLEKKQKVGYQRFDVKAYGLDRTAKDIAQHVDSTRESLNKDIDYLISKYHTNPKGMSKLTDWLEKKRTHLYNEVPLAKPVQRTNRDKIIEKAYQDYLGSKRSKLPPKLYKEDYEKEESMTSPSKTEVEFEILELPEEKPDLVTILQQVLRGRAYQKEILELIEKHRDTLEVLLPSQIKS